MQRCGYSNTPAVGVAFNNGFVGIQNGLDFFKGKKFSLIRDIEVSFNFIVGNKGRWSVLNTARVQLHFFHIANGFGSAISGGRILYIKYTLPMSVLIPIIN
jgi:hypothetical protein